jgi:hypothetical protein
METTPKQLAELLSRAIPARLAVLISGAPGIGKSDIVAQAARDAGADVIMSHPAVADPTDAKGLPWMEIGADHATFMPFGELYRACKAERDTVWFLDDLGQAPPAVQASFMQLLLARRVNGHVLPDCVSFVAATNRRVDRAGVTGILEPVKSRFACIVELKANLDDWCQWAYGVGYIPPSLIAFLRFRPELLSDFKPSADMTNSPCPRTWASAAKLEALRLSPGVETAAIAGAVGEGAAVEYLAFRKMMGSMVTADQVLIDPKGAAIPSKPGELYAISVALAMKANEKTLPRVGTYVERMVDAGFGEFATLLMRDAVRRDMKLVYSPAFIKLANGRLGTLISGEEVR